MDLEKRKILESYAVEIGKDFGYNFDYSDNSIRYVAKVLQSIHDDFSSLTVKEKKLKSEAIFGIAMEMAAYMISVIEKRFGEGSWNKDDNEYGKDTWPFTHDNFQIFPVNWCLKQIERGKSEDVWVKYSKLLQGL